LDHLGTEPGTQAYSAIACPLWQAGMSTWWGSKQAHRATHKPISVVSQCDAGAWLNRLASRDQRRLTRSGSAS